MKTLKFRLIPFTLLLSAFANGPLTPAQSAETHSVKTPHVTAQLLSQTLSIQPGQSFNLAVRLETEPHWHTYWKVSGDSGKPTRLEWQTPKGITPGKILWPAPKRLAAPPLVNFGYEEEAFLIVPMSTSPSLKATEVTLSVLAKWLVCKEVCLPGKATLQISLPVKDSPPKPHPVWAPEFHKVIEKLPKALPAHYSVKARENGGSFEVTLHSEKINFEENPIFSEIEFFPLREALIEPSAIQAVKIQPHQLFVRLTPSEYLTETPEHLDLLMSGSSGAGSTKRSLAYQFKVPLQDGLNLWTALIFAFIGGLILNLMPCVFPILSIKVLSFVKKASESQSSTFKYGLAYSAGVLVTFWALSFALILLRVGGQELGWGFQLQAPFFIGLLMLVFLLMGLSLLGRFEFGHSLMGLGQNLTTQQGLRGSFFTGLLAVVVATPCTAPFMGAAIGFALAQSHLISFSVFTALGIGMALPYLLLTTSPRLARRLPKPGAWMDWFKKIMSLPLFATVVWLAWVYSLQTTYLGWLLMTGAALVTLIAAWVWHQKQRWLPFLILISLALGLSFLAARHEQTPISTKQAQGVIEWHPFDEAKLLEARHQGKSVFINFTAAWCVSCQVNERVAFESETFQSWVTQNGSDIIFMKGDWTNQNPQIGSFLGALGRSGVPVYAWYQGTDPGSPPHLLPELLTAEILIENLSKPR